MTSFHYKIQSSMGLHARPTGIMVKRLKPLDAQVIIRCGERSADAKKLFSVMSMAVKQGETVTIEIDGPEEETLKEELSAFFSEHF